MAGLWVSIIILGFLASARSRVGGSRGRARGVIRELEISSTVRAVTAAARSRANS